MRHLHVLGWMRRIRSLRTWWALGKDRMISSVRAFRQGRTLDHVTMLMIEMGDFRRCCGIRLVGMHVGTAAGGEIYRVLFCCPIA